MKQSLQKFILKVIEHDELQGTLSDELNKELGVIVNVNSYQFYRPSHHRHFA